MSDVVTHVIPDFHGAWAMITHMAKEPCERCRTQTKVKDKK